MASPRDESEDIAELLSNLVQGQRGAKGHSSKKSFFKKRHRPNKKTSEYSWGQLESIQTSQRAQYADNMFGSKKKLKKRPHQQPNYHTIAIQIPTGGLKPIKHWVRSRKRSFIRLGLILLLMVIALIGFTIFQNILGSKNKKAADDSAQIAPSTVIAPRNLPEGFSIGSSSQKLENGAVLYLVYDNKGNEISITQQAKPANLDSGIFAGAQSFDTRLGRAYIIEGVDRITGYILTDTTLLLFNSTGAVSSLNLRQLMESFQP